MITDDEVLRLFERADPARVDDDDAVIDAAGYLDALRTRSSNVTLIGPAPTPTEPTNRHRRPIIIAAAAAVLVIVIGAAALATRDDSTAPVIDQPPPATQTQDDTSTDPFDDRVWPAGATPRGPVTGELVASVWASQQGWHFVYADGRLIRVPRGGPREFREQRLSPEGVDLVQAEITASGLFEPDRPPPGSELGFQAEFVDASSNLGAIYGDIRARIGDRLVYLARRPDEEWTSKFDQLSAKLTNLESWLPPSAWADPKQVVYVPSHYAVCMSVDELSSIETLLPVAAADLLADARRWTPEPWEQVPGDDTQRCFDLTTDDARGLAEVLNTEIRPTLPPVLVQVGSHRIQMMFLPYMPHGAVECACYGIG